MGFPEGYGPREHERALSRLQRDIDRAAGEGEPASPPPSEKRAEFDRADHEAPPLRLVRVPARDEPACEGAGPGAEGAGSIT